MSEELKTSKELTAEATTQASETPETTETAAPEEPAETMADYSEELEASFKQIHEGDILTGTVIASVPRWRTVALSPIPVPTCTTCAPSTAA